VGWGNASATIDPRALYALHFRFAEGQAHEVWLDDLEWIRSDTVNHGEPCGPVCPLTAAPRDATLAPAQISAEHAAAGLTVHTFDQATKRCGPLTRRYLSYLPRSFRAKSSAPVVIALHGHGASAEAFRDFQTHARFEALSERDGFIVVYANAAPGAATSPRLPNSGAWRQDPSSLEEVDDLGYLEAVRSDLQKREVIDGTNQVFLVGQSNGGGMVLEAARSNPGRFAGFAALMPYAGRSPALPTPASPVGLTRVLFVYSEADPGLPAGYSGTLRALAEAWARVLGVPEAVVAAPIRTPLPDPVDEGAGYTGPLAILRATRQSRGERLDFAAERGSLQAPAVRLIVFDHAGHFWPNPLQDTAAFALEKWGLRNQDIDATDAVWDFFREVAKR
jgi:poly(3-hydroxybutyrate) depolymerase